MSLLSAKNGKLSFSYLSVLTALALLLLASYAANFYYLKTMEKDGYLINLSGRQRMLSQRIILLSSEKSKALDDAIELMSESHQVLVSTQSLSPSLRELYFSGSNSLDHNTREFISKARGRLDLQESEDLLLGLNAATALFQLQYERHNRTLVIFQTIILGLGIMTLILAGVFVFRPMILKVVERAEQVRFLLEIAVTAHQSKTLEEAIERVLERISIYAEWEVGHAYLVSRDDSRLLMPSRLWYLKDQSSFQAFVEITSRSPLKIGAGLPGRVLGSGAPSWIDDVTTDDNFPRAKAAVDIGVRSAFGFPVTVQGKTVAVLEFFSKEVIRKDQELLQIIAHVGDQLGQVYERQKSEQDIRVLNETLEQRVAEQGSKLITSSKMSALGEMAGGIAHEINSPLAIIGVSASQLSELLAEGSRDAESMAEMARTIEQTSMRIAQIVTGLRTFSRDSSNDPFIDASVASIVHDTLAFCGEKFKLHGVRLTIAEIPESVSIRCRPSQISQVILNLLGNAFDAVSSLDEKWVKLEVRDTSDSVEIAVTDSGSGISATLREKLFQPFFTTKEIGKGTGLGLSVSRGLIEVHRGELFIQADAPNTKFVVRLPKASVASLMSKMKNAA